MDIAIYGAGGLGREVACMISKIIQEGKEWDFIGFFDDGIEDGTEIYRNKVVIGGFEKVNSWPTTLLLVICIASPKIREEIIYKITNKKISYPNIISSDFQIEDSDNFIIGCGNIIKSNCKVTTNVSIGNFNILNGSITFGHDVVIGNHNIFMPGVRISGEVGIGDRNLFGSMSFVKQCITVGNDITLSPLSPLLSRPKDGKTYIGNPARIFKF